MREVPLPPNLGRLLQSELKIGETVLWTGQPSPARMAQLVRDEFRAGVGLVLCGLLWLGGLIYLWVIPHGGTVPHKPYHLLNVLFGIIIGVTFPLSGILAVAGGLAMLHAPKRQRESAANTVYVLTNRRGLILQGHGRSGNVTAQSLPPYTFSSRIITEEEGGSGDLTFPDAGTFSPQSHLSRLCQSVEQETDTNIPVGFYGILNVKEVDELIRQSFGN